MPHLARSTLAALAFCAAAATPASAHTATIGATAPASLSADPLFTEVQCLSALQQGSRGYVVPYSGRLTSWSYQGQPTGARYANATAQLQVYRPLGPGRWMLAAESAPEVARPRALNRFPVAISVRAGDILGLHATIGCMWTSRTGAALSFGAAVATGATVTPDGPGMTGARLNVSATLASTTRRRSGRRPGRRAPRAPAAGRPR